jgi:hypothetical protein
MVEEMLAPRGICVTYETVRKWGKKFGKSFEDQIRQRAPGDKWHCGLGLGLGLVVVAAVHRLLRQAGGKREEAEFGCQRRL